MGRRAFIPLAAGVAGFLFFHQVRAWPTDLAGLIGVAVLLFAWAAVRTWERVRETLDK